MGYIIRRLHRLKKEAKYRVIKQQAGEEDEVKAKRTSLKKALYQRAILTTIDQVGPHIRRDGPKEYLKKIQDPKFKERRPNKNRPHDVDRIVPPPHEAAKADYEEDETPNSGGASGSGSKPDSGRSLLRPKAMLKKPSSEDKPDDKEEKKLERKIHDGYYNPSEETINNIIEALKDARTVNKGTSAQTEIDLLRKRARLSSDEMRWLRLSAMNQVNAIKGDGEMPNKHQLARYEAWIIRLVANDQNIPSKVLELEKLQDELD